MFFFFSSIFFIFLIILLFWCVFLLFYRQLHSWPKCFALRLPPISSGRPLCAPTHMVFEIVEGRRRRGPKMANAASSEGDSTGGRAGDLQVLESSKTVCRETECWCLDMKRGVVPAARRTSRSSTTSCPLSHVLICEHSCCDVLIF